MHHAFASLDSAFYPLLERLSIEPFCPLPDLRQAIETYLAVLEVQQGAREFLDIRTARAIAATCTELLELAARDYSPENHRVMQIAVRYFVLGHDVEGDATSIIGFDDDAEVVNLAKRYLTGNAP